MAGATREGGGEGRKGKGKGEEKEKEREERKGKGKEADRLSFESHVKRFITFSECVIKTACSVQFIYIARDFPSSTALYELGNDIECHKKDVNIRPIGVIKKFNQCQKI